MPYACFLDKSSCTETITTDVDAKKWFEQPLYTTLCDVMSLELYETYVQLLNDSGDLPPPFQCSEFEDACNILVKENRKKTLAELFIWLHYLKAWFAGMQHDERLVNNETFRSYCELILRTPLPVIHPVENHPSDLRLFLNISNPDYTQMTDLFLESIAEENSGQCFIAETLSEVLALSLYQLLRDGSTIGICKNCRRYFVAHKRSNAIYCDRISPQDETKSCKEYGAYSTQLERMRSDEATRLYRQLYNRMQNRFRRSKSEENPEGNQQLRSEIEAFTQSGALWKKQIQSGQTSEKEYIQWLKKRKGELDGTLDE